MAMSKLTLVRREGFSKMSVTFAPLSDRRNLRRFCALAVERINSSSGGETSAIERKSRPRRGEALFLVLVFVAIHLYAAIFCSLSRRFLASATRFGMKLALHESFVRRSSCFSISSGVY